MYAWFDFPVVTSTSASTPRHFTPEKIIPFCLGPRPFKPLTSAVSRVTNRIKFLRPCNIDWGVLVCGGSKVIILIIWVILVTDSDLYHVNISHRE